MSTVTMKQLLEAGVHFGHQTRRWNPKMKPYIFGAKNGIYIIDLQKTVRYFKKAYEFVQQLTAEGKKLMFVGTKRQAQDAIYEEATRCQMPYVNYRWLGGMLTNFQTIKKGIDRLRQLESMLNDGSINEYPKKEVLRMKKELLKLKKNLGGVKEMEELPGAIFIIDAKKEKIAINEARRLGIPMLGVIDTNCDPGEVDYVIPGNDDAIRAIRLFTSLLANACLEGTELHQQALRSDTEGMEADLEQETKDEGLEELEIAQSVQSNSNEVVGTDKEA